MSLSADLELGLSSSPLVPCATMSISQFCSWIRNAGAGIQQTIIPDIYWWAKLPTPLSPGSLLKHQFLVSRFHYTGVEYELTLERAGKDILDPFRRAVDLATLSIAGHEESPMFYRRHKLICALLTDTTLVPVGIESHAAFVEFMDHKWRGPPLTLLDLARYTETINLYKPKYSLFGGNCYMFSRLVLYAVALRHYSFPFFASSVNTTTRRFSSRYRVAPDSEKRSRISDHDLFLHYESSSTSRIFNVLYYEEFYSGALLLRRLLIILSVLFIPSSIGAYWRFVWFDDRWWQLEWAHYLKWLDYLGGLGVVGSLGGLALISFSFIPIMFIGMEDEDAPIGRIHDPTRCKTKFVMQQFDEGTEPRSIRGDYVFLPKRQFPTGWENDEQIYQPERTEYLAALDRVTQIQEALDVITRDEVGRSHEPWVPFSEEPSIPESEGWLPQGADLFQLDDAIVLASSAVSPTGSDNERNLEICDAIRSRSVPAKDAMLSLKRRLKHRNPNVQILALENGGDLFLLQIASSRFMDDLVSILKSPDLHDKVKNHILLHIQDWHIMFEGKPTLSYVGMIYTTLTAEGFQFPPRDLFHANPAMLNMQQPPEWIDSEFCSRCATRFHLAHRKHHCRNCGLVFDQQCSAKMHPLPRIGFRRAVRVCDGCYATLTSNPG